jgi:hypothetical protein
MYCCNLEKFEQSISLLSIVVALIGFEKVSWRGSELKDVL